MTEQLLRGVTVATVLPFDDQGAIDWKSFERLLAYCTRHDGIGAVFVNGHAGESSALDADERSQVIRFARERIAPGQRLVAGLVARSVDDAVQQALAAKRDGAQVLTVFPLAHPFLEGPALAAAQVAHVRAIGEAADMPLAVFQYPVTTPESYATPTLEAIARLPWVVGVKEGSDRMEVYENNVRALHAANPKLAVLPSNFDWFLPQLAVGGDGILSGLASLVPRGLCRLWQASERNDLAAMRRANDAMFELVRAVYALPRSDMYARIKLALCDAGVIASAHSRTCKTRFTEADRAALARGLALAEAA